VEACGVTGAVGSETMRAKEQEYTTFGGGVAIPGDTKGPAGYRMTSAEFVRSAQLGSVDVLLQAITNGQNVNCANRYGVTPLMAAAVAGRPRVVEVLLEAGAAVELTDYFFGCTPLMFGCMSGNAEVVKLILRSGAKVDCTDMTGRTPLMVVAATGSFQIAESLLEHGAEVNIRNRFGATSLDLADRNGNSRIAALLVAHGAATWGAEAGVAGRALV